MRLKQFSSKLYYFQDLLFRAKHLWCSMQKNTNYPFGSPDLWSHKCLQNLWTHHPQFVISLIPKFVISTIPPIWNLTNCPDVVISPIPLYFANSQILDLIHPSDLQSLAKYWPTDQCHGCRPLPRLHASDPIQLIVPGRQVDPSNTFQVCMDDNYDNGQLLICE